MADETDDIRDTFWRSQLWISLWPLWLLLYVPLAVTYWLDLGRVALLLSTIPMFIVGIGIVLAHIGLILDGRAIKKSEQHSWKPWWLLYFVASFLVGVFFVAPIYVIRRKQKTGQPTVEDVKRKLSLRGVLIPWH